MDATNTTQVPTESASHTPIANTPLDAPVEVEVRAGARPARRRSPAPTEAHVSPWLIGAVESVLLSLNRPMSAARIAEGLSPSDDEPGAAHGSPAVANKAADSPSTPLASQGLVTAPMIDQAVLELNQAYESTNRSFRIERVASGYRIMTLSTYADAVARFHDSREPQRLSRPAIETLAIIAYKQPITRAHLEAIRGVACGEVLKSLLERQLIVISGRSEELGRPMLYATGPKFLTSFGLASIKDLPQAESENEPKPNPNAPANANEPALDD